MKTTSTHRAPSAFSKPLWTLIAFLATAGAWAQAPSDLLRAREAELEKQARDTAIQMAALEELIGTAPAKLEALAEYALELERLRGELERINQNNLIKLLLLMSYEVYNTIDGTVSGGKAVVESFMNLGIRYTLGRVAFENAGAAGQKALGLDTSNYLGPRTVSVRRLSEAAVAESVEVAKVHVALNRDLNYYRALVQAEQGADPGERGAILRKNLVVRQHIELAIEALNRMRSKAVTEVAQAEADLTWLVGEGESIGSLLSGVRLQLAEALAEELAAGIAVGVSNVLGQVVEPADPAPFQFQYPPNDPDHPDPDYHHDYYTARFQAGAARIVEILDAAYPGLEAQYRNFTNQYHGMLRSHAETIAWVQDRTQQWEKAAQLPAEAFRSLHETYYDLQDAERVEAELRFRRDEWEGLIADLESLEPTVVEFTRLKRTTKGCEAIALASAYTLSEPVPAGQTPRPVLGTYTLEHYLAARGWPLQPSWGPESLGTMPQPLSFADYHGTLQELTSWQPQIDTALANLVHAQDSFKAHLAGLQSAYGAALQTERARQGQVSAQTERLLVTLMDAELLCAGKPYCAPSALIEYLEIHTTVFNPVSLSRALATALDTWPSAARARAIWQDYLEFVPQYEALDVHYREAAWDVVRGFAPGTGITAIRMELEAARDAAAMVEAPAPQPTPEAAALVESAYYQAYHDSREARTRESARSLPDPALLEPMPTVTVTNQPHINDPLVKALPVYGLVLIQEHLERRFAELMDQPTRDESAMWAAVQEVVTAVNEWKAAHPSVPLAYSFHSTADRITGEKLYGARMEWEAAFAPPAIVSRPNYLAIPPGTHGTLRIEFRSQKAVTCVWYQDNWFGEDERVGEGPELTIPAPAGLVQYYCVVANIFGETSTGRIDVFPASAPQVAQEPLDASVPNGAPTQLTVGLYFITGPQVEQTGQWHVSLGESTASGFRAIPGATATVLNLKSVTALRWYYYEASNPWGTTRSRTAKVSPASVGKALVLGPGPVSAYVGVPFACQIDGVNSHGFEFAGTRPAWLELDGERGLLQGTPSGAAGDQIQCPVRAYQILAGTTNYSTPSTIQLKLHPSSEWGGPLWSRYFSPQQFADPQVGAPGADPDGDGIPNEVEYLLGTSPVSADGPESRPSFQFRDGKVLVSFERRRDRSAAPYALESSSNLSTWNAITGLADNVVETLNDRESVAYEAEVGERRFLQLKAISAPNP